MFSDCCGQRHIPWGNWGPFRSGDPCWRSVPKSSSGAIDKMKLRYLFYWHTVTDGGGAKPAVLSTVDSIQVQVFYGSSSVYMKV